MNNSKFIDNLINQIKIHTNLEVTSIKLPTSLYSCLFLELVRSLKYINNQKISEHGEPFVYMGIVIDYTTANKIEIEFKS